MPSSISLDQLPPLEITPRLSRMLVYLDEQGCDALIVTNLENIRYLTGFSGSAAVLCVTSSASLLATDGRYKTQASEQLAAAGVDAEIVIGNGAAQLDAIVKLLSGTARIGLESTSITWAAMRRYHDALSAELVATRGLVEALRVVKDEGEQARIEAACDIADAALESVKHRLSERPSEVDFAAELEFAMRTRGGQGPSFETIVASGPNSAMPHARPTGRVVAPGDLVVVDFGSIVDGYHSDMTRTFSVGAPSAARRQLVEAVERAQAAGVQAVKEGASGASVDAAARASLVAAGYGEVFLHSTGHGVGLDIHEAPWAAAGATDILGAGTIVTVEPGAYLAGDAGVRIEDTLVVTATGCRPLTKSTKDYIL